MTGMFKAAARIALIAGWAIGSGASDAGVLAPVRVPIPTGTARAMTSPTALYLRTGTVDTSAGRRGFQRVAGVRDAARTRYVIQLDGPITPQRRLALHEAGIELGEYLPMYAYIVRADRADPDAVAALGFIRWFAPYQNQWKIDPDIGRRVFETPDRIRLDLAARERLVVTLFKGVRGQSTIDAIAALPGAGVLGVELVGLNTVVYVEMNRASVGSLALMPDVQYIETAPEVTLRGRLAAAKGRKKNSTDRWIVQSNLSGVTPFYDNGIRGDGQIIGVLDGKVDQNHCSFAGQIVSYLGSPGADLHGTHVAATAMGNAGADNNTRGVGWGADLAYAPIPSFGETGIVNRLGAQHSAGARLHTNSWGNDGTTAYDSLARGFDRFCFENEDDFVCLAVTNTSTLKNPENAKNLLAVGASRDAPSQDQHCSGGRGPTSDGRRKPEIYAPGCNTQSARAGSSCSTTGLTGTSMASPAIAGTAALVRQYYVDGYFPSGVPTPTDAFTPSGALIKATLLNSAVDMTGVAGYPSTTEGWGRVLLDNALFLPNDARQTVTRDVRNASGLSTGQSAEFPVDVLGSGEQLRVTVVWTDPPATAGASFAAVNDLDLEVVSPSGTLYRGNVFSGGVSTPGGAKDDRNNVEQVHVSNPEVGQWTVRVVGAAVNQGAQGYAAVVSGDVDGGGAPPPPPDHTVTMGWSVQAGSTTLSPGQSVTLLLSADRDSGNFYAGGKFNVRIDGLQFSDALDTGGGIVGPEPAGDFTLGRDEPYRNFPADGSMTYTLAGTQILGSALGDSIDHAVIFPILGGDPPRGNPTPIWRVTFTAGSDLGDRTFVTQFQAATVGDAADLPADAEFVDGSITISVVQGSPCLADIDGDGDADVADFFAFVVAFAAGDPAADINGDGTIDVSDFFAFVAAFAVGCP